MACRVGIDVSGRIDKWAKDEGHDQSAILMTNPTYDEALLREGYYANLSSATDNPRLPRSAREGR